MRPHEEYIDRFWKRVQKPVSTEGCWLWMGSTLPAPRNYGRFYPKFKIDGKRTGLYAHVVSWEFHNGRAVGVDMEVCHTCDNPQCVRPEHLFEGTHTDNMQDAEAKGRLHRVAQPGESHPNVKLTDEAVREIRRLWATGEHRQKDLAVRFGVTRGLIGHIVRRIAWKHL